MHTNQNTNQSNVVQLKAVREAISLAPSAGIKRTDAIRWASKNARLAKRNLEGLAWRKEAAQRRETLVQVLLGGSL